MCSSIRSQSQMQAVFLRHEGYLGALGALMSYRDHNGENLILEESNEKVSVNKDILFISKKTKISYAYLSLSTYSTRNLNFCCRDLCCFHAPFWTNSRHNKVNHKYKNYTNPFIQSFNLAKLMWYFPSSTFFGIHRSLFMIQHHMMMGHQKMNRMIATYFLIYLLILDQVLA
jgi:hypothetical protein